ncbi:MAG: hypothetical protein HQM13_23905 [SAR324 cluster bacterium]|nr:hypothetical protein [SAR324 cluster bacterium]
MESKLKLSESELLLLLGKKLSSLKEFYELTKKQISSIDENELDRVIDQKDQCIAAMRKADEVIAVWHEVHTREHNEKEQVLLDSIQAGINEILDLEQQFENQLQQEKASISAEMDQLRNRSQVKNYLASRSAAGKNLSFRR